MAHTIRIELKGRSGGRIFLDGQQITDAVGVAVFLDAEQGPRVLLELAPSLVEIEGEIEDQALERHQRRSDEAAAPSQAELLGTLARGLDAREHEQQRQVWAAVQDWQQRDTGKGTPQPKAR